MQGLSSHSTSTVLSRAPRAIRTLSGRRRAPLGVEIGLGLAAGFVGTAVLTAIQILRIRATGGEPSTAAAQGLEKTLRVKPENDEAQQRLNNIVHWSYGSTWGIARAILAARGIRGLPATVLHLGAVWGTALVMLPAMKLAPPVRKWGGKALASDLAQHAAYAVAAGITYDRLATRLRL
jgi:hypothetical protein